MLFLHGRQSPINGERDGEADEPGVVVDRDPGLRDGGKADRAQKARDERRDAEDQGEQRLGVEASLMPVASLARVKVGDAQPAATDDEVVADEDAADRAEQG